MDNSDSFLFLLELDYVVEQNKTIQWLMNKSESLYLELELPSFLLELQ
jgi:hypothetical protein